MWQVSAWPPRESSLMGIFILLLTLIKRGDRKNIHTIFSKIPSDDLKIKNIEPVIKLVKKHYKDKPNCLLNAIFMANYFPDEAKRALYHSQLFSLFEARQYFSELAAARKIQNVLWEESRGEAQRQWLY